MNAEAEALWQLLPSLSGLAATERMRRLLLVLQAYVDDSTEPPVFLLAGFLARAEEWATLTAKWIDALAIPPKLNYFKMREAHALVGQFSGWSERDRDDRLALLSRIIKDHVLAAISAAVRHEDYEEVFKTRIAKPLDHPYWLMYHSVIQAAFEWEIGNGVFEPVDFIFDEQMGQSDKVQANFSTFYQLAPPIIKQLFGRRPSHSNDLTTKPLQAADMLAWHIHRYHYEKEKGGTLDTPTTRILQDIPHLENIWSKPRLIHSMNMTEERIRQMGLVSIYQNRRMVDNLPRAISMYNLKLISDARPNSSVLLAPFVAKAMRRFRMVDSCPLSHTPHLHRRRGGDCLWEEEGSE